MASAFDEAFRVMRQHRRQRLRLAPQRELEEEIIREEQRKSAWMDVPEWRTFWDEATKDFKVPEGWPVEVTPRTLSEADVGQGDTVLHGLLRARRTCTPSC